ncbi:MAG: methylmalonyl-CoA mutase, partial [Deltaproteobacteria bacterium]
ESADVLGLSILSGAHVPLCEKVAEELRKVGASDITWIVGGCVPKKDHAALAALGVSKVFSTGSNLDEIATFLRTAVTT